MRNKDYIIRTEKDYDAFYETLYLITQFEMLKSVKESEKEDISKMKIYNPKEPW